MISTTFYVASRVALTSLISVSFFEETVLRPIQSGPRKVSAGLVVSALKSTIILILAADEAASMYLNDETSAPSTDGHIHNAVPAAPRLVGTVCSACELHQGYPDRLSPVDSATSDQASDFIFPFHSSSSSSTSSSSPVIGLTTPRDIPFFDMPIITNCKRLSITSDTSTVACDDDRFKDVLLPSPLHLSSPVLNSMPCDSDNNTIPDLPNLAICNQLLITSDTAALVASEDDSKDVHSDKDNYTTLHPEVRASTHTTTDDCVEVSTPSTTTIDITSPLCTPYIRPLVILVDRFQITPTSITNYSIPGSARLMDALLQATMTTIHNSPSVVFNCDFIHLDGVFTDTDKTSDTKIVEHHIDTLPPRTPALAADNVLVIDNSLSINNVLTNENALTIQHAPSHPLNLRSLVLLDSFPTSLSTNTDTNPSGSTHPANASSDPIKTTPSWLKPLILVTKYRVAGQLIPIPPTALPYQPEKSRPFKLKQQKVRTFCCQTSYITHHISSAQIYGPANEYQQNRRPPCASLRKHSRRQNTPHGRLGDFHGRGRTHLDAG
ncbi:hypothetical protein CY34DRAFT_217883 [Suillus luteus UH-Slu-Lm8-n1]|uniref:Uncharacterized protein n=1 Tax=Suillus luteus UH-Slu-Lm8-n1 TaxID=930992 RepID=A0A0D0AHF8_9AGAM|nr:hypothetical protein CY34DRAFT_217883 [Suillus luteus UH-Slu-Lm8-n1]